MSNSLNNPDRLSSADDVGEIAAQLKDYGFVRLPGERTLDLLGGEARASWDLFAKSWDDLGRDLYMADGGRYRRRRHAAFRHDGGRIIRKPHQPHYQSRDYNPLNGDIQRWFDPVEAETADLPIVQAIFDLCAAVFSQAADTDREQPWTIEFHQFRIETKADHVGRPTPEGLHRDGVDWVFVMLLCRRNVRDGVTEIGSPQGEKLGRFLLQEPGDAVLLDDQRIMHGVTEIHPIDPLLPAYRDVLVVTFVRERP